MQQPVSDLHDPKTGLVQLEFGHVPESIRDRSDGQIERAERM